MEKVWLLPRSPIAGTAFGSARPLASLNLPFIAEFDRILALVQEDLIAFGFDGLVDDPNVYQLGLEGLGRDIRAALFGGGAEPPTTTTPRRGRRWSRCRGHRTRLFSRGRLTIPV